MCCHFLEASQTHLKNNFLFRFTTSDLNITSFKLWIMFLLPVMLLSVTGACGAVFQQKLMCSYEPQHQSVQRVWCRQSSADCCTGITFNQSAHSVDGGRLTVTQGSNSFTVALQEPGHGQGLYWCGVLGGNNNTIIKLAEGFFHSSSVSFMWSFIRWILLPPLPLVATFTTVYYRATTKQK